MPIYRLERRQKVALPLAECWRFFSEPRNLEKITPPEMRFEIRSELPAEMREGLFITYRVSPLPGVRLTWVTEITHVEAPHYFCDEQRLGPYKIWHHEHFFRSVSERETEVTDLIHYVPPFGAFGAMLNSAVIERQLNKIFDFRAQIMATLT